MNYAAQITLTKEYLDDPNGARHSADAIDRYLNASQGDLKRYIEEANELFFQKSVTKDVVAGSDDSIHTLPDDFGRIFSVENTTESVPVAAVPTTFQDRHDHIRVDKRFLPNGMSFTGGYYVKQDSDLGKFRIGFTSPDSSYTATIIYNADLPVMVASSGSAISQVPADYHDLMCLCAAMRGYAIEQQKFPAGLETLRQEQLMQLRSYSETFNRHSPRYMNVQE